jgi:uncharacterized protein YyaL (SSP411 family)
MPLFALLLTLAVAAPSDDRELYARLCDQVAAAYDSTRGGFVDGGGIPSEDAVELALGLARAPGAQDWKVRALGTIAWTRALRDTIGGGFVLCRTEDEPHHARIYKPAVANARRLQTLIGAWDLTGDPEYRQDAARVVDFFDRVLLDGRGGFAPGQASGLDLVPEINGIAIRAWLEWTAATVDVPKRGFAVRSLDRVWDTCWKPEFGLVRLGTFGEVVMAPQLVDQVEMGRAFVWGAQIARRPDDEERARKLGDLVLARFEDPEKGGFFTRWTPTKDGKTRRADRVPAENARAAHFLCELTTLTGDAKYRDAARRAWRALGEKLDEQGLAAAGWALAVRAAIEPRLPQTPPWPQTAENKAPERPRVVRFRLPRR